MQGTVWHLLVQEGTCVLHDCCGHHHEIHTFSSPAAVGSEPWRFKDRLHAIHLAACSRSAPVLRTLLEAGAACNQVGSCCGTVFVRLHVHGFCYVFFR
jgi:hypothetical protein